MIPFRELCKKEKPCMRCPTCGRFPLLGDASDNVGIDKECPWLNGYQLNFNLGDGDLFYWSKK